MSRGDLNNWIIDLDEISSIYIFSGSEGLWFVLAIIVFLWFILATYRIEKSNHDKIEEDLGSNEDLEELIDLLNNDENQERS
tara:strand:+ start:361 stop:606 length:246 start_codon:yes stop_codon:yes gene_type:complete